MPEVTFYTGVSDRLAFVCRLLKRAQQSGAQVLVHGQGAALGRLDAALWGFEATEFVPHVWLKPGSEPAHLRRSSIVLTEDSTLAAHCRTLLNLSADPCVDGSRFDRVLEVLSTDPGLVQAGRRRFKFYKEQGCKVTHHEVNA